MKKIFKWLGILILSTWVIGAILHFTSSEEDRAMTDLRIINKKLESAEKLADVVKLYMDVDTLKAKFPDSEVSNYADSLINLKTHFKEKAKLNEIELVKANAYLSSIEYIKTKLKAPDTAKFSDYTDDNTIVEFDGLNGYKVQIQVDARNSFGVMIRENYYIYLLDKNKNFTIKEFKKL